MNMFSDTCKCKKGTVTRYLFIMSVSKIKNWDKINDTRNNK